MKRSLEASLVLFAAAFLLCSSAQARIQRDKSVAHNDPSRDPYTEGSKDLWQAAGIVSMGGFEFANSDTETVDSFLATSDILWLETAHFELGFALGSYRVPPKEKKLYLAELTRLAEKLPAVKPKQKLLDPWLRLHLTAQRLEEIYTEFLDIVGFAEDAFPDGKVLWDGQGNYMGEGPYLGQKGKYEVLILPSEASSVAFLLKNFGLGIRRTQRWNVIERDSLTLTIHIQQGTLKSDRALFGHLAFNLAHNLFDGLKHYNYETPIWLHEGLAHSMERRIQSKFNSFDGAEGSVPSMTRKADWEPEVLKLVRNGKRARMAALIRLKGYGEIDLPMHYVLWSMVEYLRSTQEIRFGAFLAALKSRRNSANLSDGSNMPEAHRKLFKEHFSMSYAQFDEAWAEWVQANY